jgi:beta-phosphoglucomutase-like phosphatase (HAD superfamily)
VYVYRYEKFYTVVQEKILADYGKKFDRTLKAKMMGKKALEAGKIFVQETGLDGILSPKDFIEQQGTMLHDMFPDSDLMPGVEHLIWHLHAHNVHMAVATSYVLLLCGP